MLISEIKNKEVREPAALAASAQKPVGYVSQDFLDGKWNLDHIAKSDEGQISRTIPVFAKPPLPAGQKPAPDVSALVEALEWLRGAINATPENDKNQSGTWISTSHPRIKQIDELLAAYRKGGNA